jgi:hypothetical protein
MSSTRRWNDLLPNLDDPRIEPAFEEMRQLILQRFPQATFYVSYGEDPLGLYLNAVVDVEDPDEVYNLIEERLLHYQVRDALPIYVFAERPRNE